MGNKEGRRERVEKGQKEGRRSEVMEISKFPIS